MIDQTLNDGIFHVSRNFLFEVIIVTLVRQMRGTHDYVLDGAFEAPAHFLCAWAITHVMVLKIGMVLGSFSPFASERFGLLVYVGFVSNLCRMDGGVREDKTAEYILIVVYRVRDKLLENIRMRQTRPRFVRVMKYCVLDNCLRLHHNINYLGVYLFHQRVH